MPINSDELILAQDVPLENYLPISGGTLTGNLSVDCPNRVALNGIFTYSIYRITF